jgi:hypothetical protein
MTKLKELTAIRKAAYDAAYDADAAYKAELKKQKDKANE